MSGRGTHHRRNSWCSPCHGWLAALSPLRANVSDTTIRCAAERKITGKEEAYFSALKRGRRLSLFGALYSTRHWRRRTP